MEDKPENPSALRPSSGVGDIILFVLRTPDGCYLLFLIFCFFSALVACILFVSNINSMNLIALGVAPFLLFSIYIRQRVGTTSGDWRAAVGCAVSLTAVAGAIFYVIFWR